MCPVADPRTLLDTYASIETSSNGMVSVPLENRAPVAFAALRRVLDECDFLDACIAQYKGYEVAGLIRESITKALEADRG